LTRPLTRDGVFVIFQPVRFLTRSDQEVGNKSGRGRDSQDAEGKDDTISHAADILDCEQNPTYALVCIDVLPMGANPAGSG
jgi:hypothetical protein